MKQINSSTRYRINRILRFILRFTKRSFAIMNTKNVSFSFPKFSVYKGANSGLIKTQGREGNRVCSRWMRNYVKHKTWWHLPLRPAAQTTPANLSNWSSPRNRCSVKWNSGSKSIRKGCTRGVYCMHRGVVLYRGTVVVSYQASAKRALTSALVY